MTDLMTTAELERETSIPAATWRYWRHTGTGPKSARIGRRVMYRRRDVEAWLDAKFSAEDDKRVSA